MALCDQLVQASHAAHQSGSQYPHEYHDVPYMVLLQVPDQEALEDVVNYLREKEIEFSSFHDSDEDIQGLNAICTAPLTKEHRKYFRKYPLWRI